MKAVPLEELDLRLRAFFEQQREQKEMEAEAKEMAERKKRKMREYTRELMIGQLPEGKIKEAFTQHLQRKKWGTSVRKTSLKMTKHLVRWKGLIGNA